MRHPVNSRGRDIDRRSLLIAGCLLIVPH